jgi:hypothetical protein
MAPIQVFVKSINNQKYTVRIDDEASVAQLV